VVEKKVKKVNPKYHSHRAIEKKKSHLFSNAKTRECREVDISKNCKKKIITKEKKIFGFTQFDVPLE